MPDIKRIRIDQVSDSDSDLNNFFDNWCPTNFKLLWINYGYISLTPIKANFYTSSLFKAVGSATKEVYIQFFEFRVEDLQQFVKAACNAERIIFCGCSIHCSAALDFGTNLIYKTKYLSFQQCGDNNLKDLTTDWKTDSSAFSHIVDAIAKSGLRHSLTKLSIYYNETLDQAKVEWLLSEKGITNITVVPESSLPSSS